jgi:predicted amidohydrolase YtcJ
MPFEPSEFRVVIAPVVTMDPSCPRAEALASRDGRIVAVGTVDEVLAAVPVEAEVERLQGSVIVPGLIDAHLHLLRGGLKTLALFPETAAGTDVETFLAEMQRTALDDVWPEGEPTIEDRIKGLRRVQPLIHALGLTAVIDPAVTDDEMRAYQEAHRRGLLTVRVVAMPYPNVGDDTTADVEGAIERLRGIGVCTGFGDEMLRLGGIKVYFDGEGMKGQALLERPWVEGTDDLGLQRIPDHEFRRLVEFCAANSWSVGVHAVGGGAISRVLEIFADVHTRTPIRDLRFQLIHAYLEPSARSFREAERLGVVAALQPSIHWNNAAGLVSKLGERAVAANPIRSWLDAGVRVALGSDGPFFPFDPRHLMWQARTRTVRDRDQPLAPEQAISGGEALAGYTSEAAFASFAEHQRGALRPGFLADWTALSVDPTTCTPDELRTATITRTVVNGTTVHAAPAP